MLKSESKSDPTGGMWKQFRLFLNCLRSRGYRKRTKTGPSSFLCNKAGQDLPAWGLGSKKPAPVPAPGTGPDSSARDPTNVPSYTTVIHMWRVQDSSMQAP